MPEIQELDLNLRLGFRRAKLDRPDRCFVNHPHLIEWVELDLGAWLASIEAELESGFEPRDAAMCLAPKAGGLVRPGRVLDLRDEVVYNSLVGAAYPRIYAKLRPWQGQPDVAYQLRPPDRTDWVRRGVRVWGEWRQRSLELLSADHSHVVFADIAGYYDNVDLRILGSDLRTIGEVDRRVELMMKCFRRWSSPHKRGVPQGYTSSDIVAKLYLHTVDKRLHDEGFSFLRYVDDYRIFCESQVEARQALMLLAELLHARGLTLQSAKSSIVPKVGARIRIDGVAPAIALVQSQLGHDVLLAYGEGSPYGNVGALQQLAAEHPDAPPPAVLERTFRERFLEENEHEYDATLFHYLINRLAVTRSVVAIEYCLELLRQRPEETAIVLRYFEAVGVDDSIRRRITNFAGSSYSIYDYQLYEIARWFFLRNDLPDSFVTLCRYWAFDLNRAPWLRSFGMLLLGRAAEAADLERLQAQYRRALSDCERAEIVAALARMEIARRNAFYNEVDGDCLLVARAAAVVRAARIQEVVPDITDEAPAA